MVGVGFTFGEIVLDNPISIGNLVDDCTSQSANVSLWCLHKCGAIKEEVRWCMEEQSKCNTYGKIFICEQCKGHGKENVTNT